LKNRINFFIGIIVCRLSIVSFDVINFRPVNLSFSIDTRFFVFNSFVAFFLSVIQDFAVDTEFTVSGSVGTLVLHRFVVAVASVVALSPGLISVVVALLLLVEWLLLLLWPLQTESSHIRVCVSGIVTLIILHSVNIDSGGLSFVLLNSVLCEEHLIGIIDGNLVWSLWESSLRTFSGAAALKT
jgi:hypothetical protein